MDIKDSKTPNKTKMFHLAPRGQKLIRIVWVRCKDCPHHEAQHLYGQDFTFLDNIVYFLGGYALKASPEKQDALLPHQTMFVERSDALKISRHAPYLADKENSPKYGELP